MKSYLITGANVGLGKETARQLASRDETKKIYLGCRNEERCKAAKQSLEESTGKSIFETVRMDVSNMDSVRAAVASLPEPVEGLVMNAGGMGGKDFNQKTRDGVTQIFASNVLGHVVLLDELVKAKKLTKVALFAGTEAARGVPKMGMKRPALKTSSTDEFATIADGTYFAKTTDAMTMYGPVKYAAVMWVSAAARKYPQLRLISVSPGGTGGTEAARDLSPIMKFMFLRMMPLLGLMHKLEVGAKRFVDGLNDESFKSGRFYGSKKSKIVGPLVDQGTIFNDLNNEAFQDNANQAVHSFIH